jgi:hypothetical protein
VLLVGAVAVRGIVHGRPPAEAAAWTVGGTIVTAVVAVLVWAVALPPRDRRAFEAFAWCGERGRKRFRALAGGRFPLTSSGIERYVRTMPERADDLWIRAEYHGMQGHLDEARALLARMIPTTASDRVELAGDLDWIDWIGGGAGDLDAIRPALDAVPADGSDDRMGAELSLAMAEVRHRLSDGTPDVLRPLLATRDRLGSRADRILLTAAWRALPSYVRLTTFVVGVAVVLDRLIG